MVSDPMQDSFYREPILIGIRCSNILLLKDSSTKCSRHHWLIFEAMRINRTRSSDLQLRMFKEMFLPISVKWETLIEAHIHVKTANNFTLRMFCFRFTKKRDKQIRRKMVEVMVYQASSSGLKELVAKFIPEMIGKDIEKATSSIYPLQSVCIRKVMIISLMKLWMQVLCYAIGKGYLKMLQEVT
ncbi:hypothetical protein C5167_008001 [Papaver somniferum]|uniref:Uncharacterized protein n=1 Tax=Papaver somniferum TaxID=3469 RepID=A0A4Y7JT78_PAPSO|nr:hypothetical protein C5167_008001 [Papaver somniferum]